MSNGGKCAASAPADCAATSCTRYSRSASPTCDCSSASKRALYGGNRCSSNASASSSSAASLDTAADTRCRFLLPAPVADGAAAAAPKVEVEVEAAPSGGDGDRGRFVPAATARTAACSAATDPGGALLPASPSIGGVALPRAADAAIGKVPVLEPPAGTALGAMAASCPVWVLTSVAGIGAAGSWGATSTVSTAVRRTAEAAALPVAASARGVIKFISELSLKLTSEGSVVAPLSGAGGAAPMRRQ